MDLSCITSLLFYIFAACALLCAVGVIAFRNPVSSAMSMALCFGFVAAILFNLGASFLGIVQIIIYAGAILVLFLFVVMMLDVKEEERGSLKMGSIFLGTFIAAVFAGMITKAAMSLPGSADAGCPFASCLSCGSEEKSCPAPALQDAKLGGVLPALKPNAPADSKALGEKLFTDYNIHLVMLSFGLLVGCVGAIALSRKLRKD